MKIKLEKDIIFKAGTELDDISGSTTQYGSDNFEGLLPLNKDNTASLIINLDCLKEGEDYSII